VVLVVVAVFLFVAPVAEVEIEVVAVVDAFGHQSLLLVELEILEVGTKTPAPAVVLVVSTLTPHVMTAWMVLNSGHLKARSQEYSKNLAHEQTPAKLVKRAH
jgi:hypothetical protein